MTSLFDRALAAADAVFDAVGGETWTITPMLPEGGPRVRSAPDFTREPVTLTGIWQAAPALAVGATNVDAERQARRPGYQAQEARVSFAVASLPWRPATGDHVTRNRTSERFVVVRPEDEGATRLHLVLARL